MNHNPACLALIYQNILKPISRRAVPAPTGSETPPALQRVRYTNSLDRRTLADALFSDQRNGFDMHASTAAHTLG